MFENTFIKDLSILDNFFLPLTAIGEELTVSSSEASIEKEEETQLPGTFLFIVNSLVK